MMFLPAVAMMRCLPLIVPEGGHIISEANIISKALSFA